MTVEVELPDGRTVEFPDGVTPDVIQRTTKRMLAPPETGLEGHPEESFQAGYAQSFPQPAPRPASPPAPAPTPARGGLGDPGTLSGAVAEGWRDAPSFWTSPEARQTAANVPIAGPIYAAGGDIIGGVLGAGNALLRGVQHTAADLGEQVGNAVPEIRIPGYGPISGTVAGGPGLGRDVAALPEAFPFGFEGAPQRARYAGGVPRNGLMPPAGPPAPRFVQEFYGEPIPGQMGPPIAPKPPTPTPDAFVPPGAQQGPTLTRMNELIRADIEQAQRRPTEIPPPGSTATHPDTGVVEPIQQPRNPADVSRAPQQAQPGEPTGGTGTVEAKPQSAGAMATPYDLSKMDLDETKAARTTAEWQELLEPTKKGDTTEHVLGVKPTKAEIEQSAPVSTESKLLRQEFREPYSEDEASKMETIRNKLEDTAGTATVVNSMERARDARAAAQRDAIWANKSEADTTPLYKYQTDMLASEDGARPLVRNAVDRVIKELTDADGNPITDPQKLYGVRKHIDDLIAEQGASGKPANERAMAQLLGMKKVLDQQVIEPSAPGFMKYLSDYHEASKPIDVMKYLQAKVPGLMTGPNRSITFSKFDKFMKDLAIERAQKDYGGAEAMDEGTRQTLMGIWRHLQRSASDAELAKVNGSDTTQRMMQLLRTGAVQAAVHTAVGTVTGGLGNVFVPIIGEQFHRSGQMKKVQQHLNPDLSKYPMPPRNTLGP